MSVRLEISSRNAANLKRILEVCFRPFCKDVSITCYSHHLSLGGRGSSDSSFVEFVFSRSYFNGFSVPLGQGESVKAEGAPAASHGESEAAHDISAEKPPIVLMDVVVPFKQFFNAFSMVKSSAVAPSASSGHGQRPQVENLSICFSPDDDLGRGALSVVVAFKESRARETTWFQAAPSWQWEAPQLLQWDSYHCLHVS
eukprot:GHVT01080903.1.p2 GENE.GHVT01080903.1~~GHVT01080903.1.p2  ORF type:complete len:199 (-),score=40.36 GHVT01080903.1:382-978(-)